jgi:hypothetical protein
MLEVRLVILEEVLAKSPKFRRGLVFFPTSSLSLLRTNFTMTSSEFWLW